MPALYKLSDTNTPIRVANTREGTIEWAKWYETANRIVAKDNVGISRVSTVFLGADHNHSGIGKPILWETMIFGGKNDCYQERHESYEEALNRHNEIVRKLKNGEEL